MFWLVVRIVLLPVFRVVDDDAGFVNREPKVVTGAKDPEEAARMALGVDLVRTGRPGREAQGGLPVAVLLGRAPGAELLRTIAGLKGDATPLGLAHIALAQAAAEADPDAVIREYFDLFVGVVQGELVPYGSYYLTGFLHERPLARVREDLARLGVERVENLKEPEDHVAILCDVMAGLASRRFEAEAGFEPAFFERHLKPWAPRFFADLETANLGRFYRAVGRVGRMFMEIEAEAFAMGA